MKQCKCGSYAFNLYKEDIDQGDLCDVHYWRALAKPEQEPVGEAYLCDRCQTPFDGAYECPSCGHHTSTKEPVYTTPPQRTWVGLTDEDIERIKLLTFEKEINTDGEEQEAVNLDQLIRAAEQLCKEKNNV